ncbi:MAG: sulfate reduction electron transfer complex DsrMKJOP subunit DsrJ [Acidobacteria bacterium]|nr:sulfate reduction electron transfer complex DsrMKJOP subunit DsrJ [Acidobacteriota bacterium]
MADGAKVAGGLMVFVALACAPIWLVLARRSTASQPEIELPVGQKRCVESAEFMRQRHAALLVDWRDAVVREGLNRYVASDGREFRISLTGTCLGCHTQASAFCDRCHAYIGVSPECWSCHVRPSENP